MTDVERVELRVGRYEALYRIGKGGMGSVYLARARGAAGFERWVALKVIHPHLCDDRAFVGMFLDEARLSARIHHPNVCLVFDFGEADGTHYLAMEWLAGEPLSTVAEREPPPELIARMVEAAARGLHAAHELRGEDGEPLGIVHRDVSPQNLLVLFDGPTKVLDFGIARARDRSADTTTGSVKGKIAYMSPEQLRGEVVDRRSDVFALGIVLWEATLGWPLFKRKAPPQTMQAVLNEPILRPSQVREGYPEPLERVVMRALERDPGARFQTMEAMADALDGALSSLGPPAGTAQVAAWMRETFAAEIEKSQELLRAPLPSEAGPASSASSTAEREATPTARRGAGAARRRTRALAPLALLAVVAALAGGWIAAARRPPAGEVPPPGHGETAAGEAVAATGTDAATGAEAGTTAHAAPSDGAPAGEPVDATTPRDAEVEAGGVPARRGPSLAKASPPPAAREPGFANILSIPVAEVWLGSKRLGTTPLKRVSLPAGRHVLELRPLDGGSRRRVPIRVRAGEVEYLTVRLEP